MCLLRGRSQPDWCGHERLASALNGLETRSFGLRVFISPLSSFDLSVCLIWFLLRTTYVFLMSLSVTFSNG
jgi:hypothetical protein